MRREAGHTMESEQANILGPGALEDLVHGLGEQAREFTPALNGEASGGGGLPGRQPGENLSPQETRPSASAAIIIDCGTSRRSGYSHVLWISPSAEAILGSHGLDRLSDAIVRLPGVSAHEWDGLELLHLRAAGSDWGVLLDGARAAAERVLEAR